jgi:hypothetical protein
MAPYGFASERFEIISIKVSFVSLVKSVDSSGEIRD